MVFVFPILSNGSRVWPVYTLKQKHVRGARTTFVTSREEYHIWCLRTRDDTTFRCMEIGKTNKLQTRSQHDTITLNRSISCRRCRFSLTTNDYNEIPSEDRTKFIWRIYSHYLIVGLRPGVFVFHTTLEDIQSGFTY